MEDNKKCCKSSCGEPPSYFWIVLPPIFLVTVFIIMLVFGKV